MGSALERLQSLLTVVIDSSQATLYKNRFNKLPSELLLRSLDDIKNIPILTTEELFDTPYQERLYKNSNFLTKIVYKNDSVALISRTISDIKDEYFGEIGTRPLVLFDSVHEGLEKSLWCYEQNILPLINEENLEETALMAAKYEIDCIITETDTLKNFLPQLEKHYDITRIENISIVDSNFDVAFLMKHFQNADVHLILALPEIGSIGYACKKSTSHDKIVFHPSENCIVETGNNAVVTKLTLLPTPIIRYEIDLNLFDTERLCTCSTSQSFILEKNI